MTNPFGIPEITPEEVARRRAAGDDFILLDVREPQELLLANLGDAVTHVPMSELARQRTDALPEEMMQKEGEVVVICHHGNRSAQVAAWLRGQGWSNVWNMTGGIERWADEVDGSVGRY